MKRLLIALTLLFIAGCTNVFHDETPQRKALSSKRLDPDTKAWTNDLLWKNWQKDDEIEQVQAKYERSEIKDARDQIRDQLPDSSKELLAKSELYDNCMREKVGTDFWEARKVCMKILSN